MPTSAGYCTRTELTLWGAPSDAFTNLEPELQTTAIVGAASVIDGYLSARLTLPLISWGDDIRRACAIIATYDLIAATRGRNPEEAGDRDPIYDRYKETVAWLQGVAAGRVLVPTAVGQPSVTTKSVPVILSNESRGWQGAGGPFTGRGR